MVFTKSIISIIVLYYCCIDINLYSQNYWIQQTSPTTKQLFECVFVDSLYGWVSGDSGTIAHTTNSGNNWSVQNTGISSSKIEDIFFTDRIFGWAICIDSTYKTIILKTTNGGINWQRSNFPDTTVLFSVICFTDQSTGFVSGVSGRIFKTTNSSISWFECSFDTTGCLYLFPKNDIHFINSQTGFACGGVIDLQGQVYKTTNGGLFWNSLCLSPEPLNEILFRGGNNVYVMGGDYDLGSIYVRTTNLGSNWAYDTLGCGLGNATGFSFRTPAEVWAGLSFSQKFAVNIDSMKPGSIWQCIPAPDSTAIYDVEFKTSTKGWAVGTFGRIYKYNSNIIGIGVTNNNNPARFELFQNYPNPFNPATIIKYSLPISAEVKLTLYDILGNELKIIDEGVKQAGFYSIEFNASELASGVYFYRLTAGSFTESKKLVVIK